MKRSTLLISFFAASVIAAQVTEAASIAPIVSMSADGAQAYSVAVYTRDSRGATTLVGEKVTDGASLNFSEETSSLVATGGGPNDATEGHWSMRISGIRPAAAASESFDVRMEGKDPGVWEGRIDLHVVTGSGSRRGVVHWVDGKDYVIEVEPCSASVNNVSNREMRKPL